MKALSLLPLLLLFFAGLASAKNPALPRARANINVIGKVQRVYESVENGHVQHITEIRVQMQGQTMGLSPSGSTPFPKTSSAAHLSNDKTAATGQ